MPQQSSGVLYPRRTATAHFVLGVALAAATLVASPAWGQAGQILSATGDAQVRRASGQTIPAIADLAIGEGDSILTGAGSEVQLRMVDDALLTLRANTQIKFQAYRFEGREDGTERGIINLLHGALRSISGAIGRTNKDQVLIHTPAATIGIRGTDHESAYVPHTDPALPGIEPGTYDKVNSGETYIEAHGQRIVIAPEQAGFAGLDPRVAPVRLREIPSFLRGEGRGTNDGRHGKRDGDDGKRREKASDDAKKDTARDVDAERDRAKGAEKDAARDGARTQDKQAGDRETKDREPAREAGVRKDREERDERRDRADRGERTDRSDRKERRDRVRSRDD